MAPDEILVKILDRTVEGGRETRREVKTLPCEFPGCPARGQGGKPFCPTHVELMPLAAEIAFRIAVFQDELRACKRGLPPPGGLVELEIMAWIAASKDMRASEASLKLRFSKAGIGWHVFKDMVRRGAIVRVPGKRSRGRRAVYYRAGWWVPGIG